MASEYKTGLVITGDASGGVRAINTTKTELDKLNQDFRKGRQQAQQYTQQMRTTGGELDLFAGRLQTVAGLVAGVFAASSLKGQIDFADRLHKLNLRIGAGAEALSEYNYVAGLSGVQFDTVATAWQRQTRRIAQATQGTGEAVKALDELRLSAVELNAISPEQQFERIAAALEGVEDPGRKAAIAMQLWDTEGVALLQITNQGTAAMRSMREEAAALGQTINLQTATDMADYNDSVARLQALASGVAMSFLADLVPALTDSINSANAWVREMGGAAVVAEHLADAGTLLAGVYAGRVVGSLAAKTKSTLAGMAADRAAQLQTAQRIAQEQQAAAMTARRVAGEQTAAVTSARIAAQRAQQAQAEAAERLRLIQLSQQQLAAERALETQRLQAQISATGRQQSLTRLAEIRRQELALTGQATAAQRTLAAAEATTTGTTRALTLAQTELTRATGVASAAMASSATATRAASVAQAAMTGTARALSGSMALLGGPAGVAILAGSALYYFAQKSRETGVDADALKRKIDGLAGSFRELNEVERKVKLEKLNFEFAQTQAAITATEQKIASWKRNLSSLDSGDRVTANSIITQESIKLEQLQAQLLETKETMSAVFMDGIPDNWTDGNKPKEPPPPKPKLPADTSMRDQAQKWLLEMQRFNATEQQQVEHWRQDSLAQTESYYRQGLIKHEQFAFAKVAIDEEAARRLKAIEDERWAKFTGDGLGELGTLQREAQNIEGPRGELIRGGVAKEIADKTFQGLPEIKGLDAQFSGPFGEAERMRQETEKMSEDYDARIERYKLYRETQLENAALYDEQIAALEDRRRQNELAADRQIQQAKLQGTSDTFGTMADLARTFAGEQSGIYRAMFAAQKAFSLASVMMSSADAIGKAWASAPFPANLPAVGTTLLETGALQALVQGIAMPVGQAHDGIDSVPQSGTWNLEKGERVTGAALNRDLTQFLARENKQQGGHGGRGGDTPISVSVEVINHGRPAQAKTRVEQLAEREFIVQVVMEEAVSGLPGSPFNVFAGRHGLRPVGR